MIAARSSSHPKPASVRRPGVLYSWAVRDGRRFAAELRGRHPLFVCVIASTDTALVPGISAAGASTELIPFTAAADAEVLVHGQAHCIAGVPSNPLGPPGPALITLAALQLADMPALIVDAGCHVVPDAPRVTLGDLPGGHIAEGHAVANATELYRGGYELGERLAADHDCLVVSESVPGGTTTALALLLALGYAADGKVSSSLSANAHELKSRLAHEALQQLDPAQVAANPLHAVETLGDPMQAAAAGITAGCTATDTPVLLAGGTQMAAVVALLRKLRSLGSVTDFRRRVAVATTRWVVEDPTADIVSLMRAIDVAPLLATPLSFAASRYPSLRRYEEFLVKEGVGAGGAAVVAHLIAGVTCDQLVERIETLYDGLLAVGVEDATDVRGADGA